MCAHCNKKQVKAPRGILTCLLFIGVLVTNCDAHLCASKLIGITLCGYYATVNVEAADTRGTVVTAVKPRIGGNISAVIEAVILTVYLYNAVVTRACLKIIFCDRGL